MPGELRLPEMPGGRIRVTSLSRRKPHDVTLRPDPEACAAIAAAIGVRGLGKVSLSGTIEPCPGDGWQLEARLGATVEQSCVVTLKPVRSRIACDVRRRYLPELTEPEPGSETEMPADDSIEPLGREIDLVAVLAEEIALGMPEYPRAEGTEHVEIGARPDGAAEITDERANPFAVLARLREGKDG